MIETIMSASAPLFANSTTSPLFASCSEADNDNELLEMRIAETRAQLKALREEGYRQRVEHAQHYQTLQSNFDTLQHTLTKSSSRLNMFAYTHAMLQAQTTVVQPYILKKQALLCHAFHINEVLTKQIHLRKIHADGLVTVLEHSTQQVVEFWQARLANLAQQIRDTRDEVQQWHDRILMLLPHAPTQASATNHTSQWRFHADEVIIEEDDEDEYDDDDNMSSSTSSSSQWTEEPSAPPQPHQQDVLLHVLSMALTAVSEGRLPSVFDMKSLSAPPSPTRKNSNTSNSHHHTLRSSSSSSASTRIELASPKQLEDVWDDEKTTLRRSLVGLETF